MRNKIPSELSGDLDPPVTLLIMQFQKSGFILVGPFFILWLFLLMNLFPKSEYSYIELLFLSLYADSSNSYLFSRENPSQQEATFTT